MNWYLISTECESDIENQYLPRLLSMPFEAFHVRKPKWSTEQLMEWMRQWPASFHAKMVIHYDLKVATQFPVKGFHMARSQRIDNMFKQKVYQHFITCEWKHLSAAFHHLSSIENFDGALTHGWISPVYPSISKSDYQRNWPQDTWVKLQNCATFKKVALGGISQHKINDLKTKGFEHAVINGALWKSKSPLHTAEKLFINT